MTIAKKEIKVLDDHIEELEKLQKDYSEKIELLTRQREDFDVLIEALRSYAFFLLVTRATLYI